MRAGFGKKEKRKNFYLFIIFCQHRLYIYKLTSIFNIKRLQVENRVELCCQEVKGDPMKHGMTIVFTDMRTK